VLAAIAANARLRACVVYRRVPAIFTCVVNTVFPAVSLVRNQDVMTSINVKILVEKTRFQTFVLQRITPHRRNISASRRLCAEGCEARSVGRAKFG
jgi:hypothetical protein